MSGKPAARQGDMTAIGGPIVQGATSVLIDGKPAARQDDITLQGGNIVQGSASVFIEGKPASRMGDMTAIGGPIVQGSLGVMIGAPTGVACSVCPGGVTSGNPVNPLLGAKVLPGETDLALPGPMPFILSRAYSSYRTKTPAPVGMFGPGWKAPSDIRLQLCCNELILNDNGGRSIHFDPLFPGEISYSRSESFWLARGGVAAQHSSQPLSHLWQVLPEDIRLSPHVYLAANSVQGPWWVLGWADRVPGAEEVLPAPLPPYRVLTGLVDNFGRTLTYQRDADGEFAGAITAVTDGAGRRFGLKYTRMAEVPQTRYGADSGLRLMEVWLTRDPEYPAALPAEPLARYAYSPGGELTAVYDRSGTEVRHFAYDAQHPGRMVAHRYAGRPETHYRYDLSGRVAEQRTQEGLSYTYEYEKNAVSITDSLTRREVLHTEGEGGLKRVVKKERADGSSIHSEFDPYGRLTAETDAAGRRTEYRLDVSSGAVTDTVMPDGRTTGYDYNAQRQLTGTIYPDGLRRTREYDAQGRVTLEKSRSGDITRYFYSDPRSEHPSAIEDPTGSKKQLTWSRYGQLLTFTDCSGYETRYEYDRFGQQRAVHREEGLSLSRTYDSRGRLVSTRDAEGETTRYDYNAASDLTTVITPDGTRRKTQYDAWGQATGISQGGLTRQLEYDSAGRITTLINENGSQTTFTYDALDRLTQETGFDGRTQRYHYDLTGKLTRSEDEDLITCWQYDASDRLTQRTVNNEPAEAWRYDERGWLTDISQLSEGHRVAVHYGYDRKGRLIREQQTVHDPETEELLWQHETLHEYNAGLASRFKPDQLPPVEWLTYGSGYLAGMKLGDTPRMEFTRDRLHRETQRSFGDYDQATAWTPGGQLASHHLNNLQLDRDYGWNENGQLVRISGQNTLRDYQYDAAGRLSAAAQQKYHTDPAGNRTTDRDKFPTLPAHWRDNRITEDADYFYHYDAHGRLTEKVERQIRADGSLTHHYDYDLQHRLTTYRLMQGGNLLTRSHYLYDPLGRRIHKRVWQRKVWDGLWYLPAEPAETEWYGWDGDCLTTTEMDDTRIQTVYLPGTFTPLLRVETASEELAKTARRTLAETLQQDSGVEFVPEVTAQLNNLARKIHLYNCDHRGLPLALVSEDGNIVWSVECGVRSSMSGVIC